MPSRTNALRMASAWLDGSCSRPRLPWMLRKETGGEGKGGGGVSVEAGLALARQAEGGVRLTGAKQWAA